MHRMTIYLAACFFSVIFRLWKTTDATSSPVCLVTNSENNVFEREQMVELECRLCSDGVKSPLVEFRYRRVSSKDWLRVTDQTAGFILARSSLIIRRFLDEEKGNYKCTINGTDSNPVRLRMKEDFKLFQHPKNQTLKEGDSLNVDVSFKTNKLTFLRVVKTEDLNKESNYTLFTFSSPNQSHRVFSISHVKLAHQGLYTLEMRFSTAQSNQTHSKMWNFMIRVERNVPTSSSPPSRPSLFTTTFLPSSPGSTKELPASTPGTPTPEDVTSVTTILPSPTITVGGGNVPTSSSPPSRSESLFATTFLPSSPGSAKELPASTSGTPTPEDITSVTTILPSPTITVEGGIVPTSSSPPSRSESLFATTFLPNSPGSTKDLPASTSGTPTPEDVTSVTTILPPPSITGRGENVPTSSSPPYRSSLFATMLPASTSSTSTPKDVTPVTTILPSPVGGGGNSLLIGLVCGAVLLLLLLLAFIIGTRIVIVRNRAGIRSPARPEAEIPLPEVSTSTDGDTMRDRQLNAIQRDVNDLGNDIQDMFQKILTILENSPPDQIRSELNEIPEDNPEVEAMKRRIDEYLQQFEET
ncbi:probable maltase-glucoamylase 2 [Oscarella lobularis]|uniref:probable maltase-glucoamylase 2 n=1 Tax=Oscarella lobularis TaxID=121494 RepID=UPI003313B917